jgi:hypothetical protein
MAWHAMAETETGNYPGTLRRSVSRQSAVEQGLEPGGHYLLIHIATCVIGVVDGAFCCSGDGVGMGLGLGLGLGRDYALCMLTCCLLTCCLLTCRARPLV